MAAELPVPCNLLYAFQSASELYLVMPFMQGGDLRYHLREHGPLSEAHVKFYAAELLCAMADLHAKRVVFRDLRSGSAHVDIEEAEARSPSPSPAALARSC